MSPRICSVEGCGKKHEALGLCRVHYMVEARRRRRLKLYNITAVQYQAAYEAQGGLCAICNRPETKLHHHTNAPGNLCVDHDHATGENRGLLCTTCNIGLGYFKDDPALLRAADEYLAAHIALKAK